MKHTYVKKYQVCLLIVAILLLIGAYIIYNKPRTQLISTKTATHARFTKTAMVTGGARGIGEAYVVALLKRGYKVAIIDKLNADKKANELGLKYGKNNVIGIHCDITDRRMYKQSFDRASKLSSDGILDIVIFNAGINHVMFGDAAKIIETNLIAPIYGTELYTRQVTGDLKHKTTKDCLIIITGSLASFVSIDINLSPAYGASKAGIGTFVRDFKPIASRFNMRINAICPAGMVNTKMVEKEIDTPFKRKMNDILISTEGRGALMEPNDMVPALYAIIDNNALNGELIAVSANKGMSVHLEPRDDNKSFAEYGIWDENKSNIMSTAIDGRLNDIKQRYHIWSD